MKKILILFIIIIPLTGCFNYRELNELAIIDAYGIDYFENNFHVSSLILNVEKSGSEKAKEKANLYTGVGKSLTSATRNMSLSNPKEMYVGHLSLIILGKSIINDDISKLYEVFVRDPHIRTDSLIIVSPNNDAKDILNQKNDTEEIPSKAIVESIKTSAKNDGIVLKLPFESLVKTSLQKGIDPVITTIYLEEIKDEKKEILKDNQLLLSNLAVFKNNKIACILSKNASIAYNVIQNNINTLILDIPFEDTTSTVEIYKQSSTIDLKIDDNKINVIFNIDINGDIIELNKEYNAKDKKILTKINESISNEIKSYINELIKTCKEKNIDPLGLKSIINKQYNKKYNEYKDKNIYDIANIKINIHSNIYKEGELYEGIKN